MKTNIKKVLFTTGTVAIMFGGLIAPAFAAGPTTGPVAGPGCFGNWRAGSVQAINSATPAGTDNAGQLAFSVRAGDNSTMNADARAQCAALSI